MFPTEKTHVRAIMNRTPVTARQGRYSDSLNLIRLLAALQVLYEHTLARI